MKGDRILKDPHFESFLQKAVHGFPVRQLGAMTALTIPMFENTGLVKAYFTLSLIHI